MKSRGVPEPFQADIQNNLLYWRRKNVSSPCHPRVLFLNPLTFRPEVSGGFLSTHPLCSSAVLTNSTSYSTLEQLLPVDFCQTQQAPRHTHFTWLNNILIHIWISSWHLCRSFNTTPAPSPAGLCLAGSRAQCYNANKIQWSFLGADQWRRREKNAK